MWPRLAVVGLVAWLCALPTAFALYPGTDMSARLETALGAAVAPMAVAAAILFWKRDQPAGGLHGALIIVALASGAIYYMIS